MGFGYGSSIVKDGLVLAYDNGGGQSWKGAPTTNLVTAIQNYSGEGTYWNRIDDDIFHFYLTTAYASWCVRASAGAYTTGKTYTFSFEYRGDNPASGDLTLDNDGADDNTWNATLTTTTEWQTYTQTRTTSATAEWRMYFRRNGGGNIYIKNVQLEEHSFASPFVNGTRSTTQALIDWVGGQTITMRSLTDYNSDNTFSFDGTNNTDRGISLPSQNLNGSYSVEAWFKFDTGGTTQGIVGDTQYAWYRFTLNTNNQIYAGHKQSESPWVTNFLTAPTQLSTGTWHHAVQVFDQSAGMRIYINGELDVSNTNTANFTLSGRGPQWVGQDRPSSQATRNVLDGTVPILRIYKNKALSAAEVAQNYNALRGRFGV